MNPTPNDLSALTVLLAVILGPLVSVYIMKRHIAAQVLSTNRQDWINTLRHHLSGLVAVVTSNSMRKGTGFSNDKNDFRMMDEVHAHWANISLLLNPNESGHCELVKEIESLLTFLYISEAGGDPAQIRHRLDRLVAKSQGVLKREWERVKKGA